MKVVLSLCLLSAASARAETSSPPCQPSGFVYDAHLPSNLPRVSTRPTVILPLEHIASAEVPMAVALITVEVRDAADTVFPGRVRAGNDVTPYLPGPVWQPDAQLPLGVYTMRFEVASTSDVTCPFMPISGEMRFVVIADEVSPALGSAVSFHDRETFTEIGITQSCGPAAVACGDRPGLCCVRDGQRIERTLAVEVDVDGFDGTHAGLYRVVLRSASAEQEPWSEMYTLEPGPKQVRRVTTLAADALAPGAGEGCVEVTLIDLAAAGAVVATNVVCADPVTYERQPDFNCDFVCRNHDDPIGFLGEDGIIMEVVDAAEAIPDNEPRRSEGCAGGAASGLGLVALMVRRRRVSYSLVNKTL